MARAMYRIVTWFDHYISHIWVQDLDYELVVLCNIERQVYILYGNGWSKTAPNVAFLLDESRFGDYFIEGESWQWKWNVQLIYI